jgi:flagellar motor switch protein FliN/FliY
MAETETTQQQAEQGQAQAQSVEFSEANASPGVGPGGSIDILLDMNVPVTAAIGKKEMSIRRLLQLGPGSVLKLDKPIEAPADLYLRDKKFATGTVVVVEGQFAIRIKDIIGLGEAVEEPGDE